MGSNLLNYAGPEDDPYGNIAERERLEYERNLANMRAEEQAKQDQEAKSAAVRAAFASGGSVPRFDEVRPEDLEFEGRAQNGFGDVTSGASSTSGARYTPRPLAEDDNDPVGPGIEMKKALEMYLAGVGSGASSTAQRATVSRTENESGMAPMSEEPRSAGKVDVTIDGKTYSYAGGQRGGENGPAPTLDLQASGYSPSGYSTKAFGGEADRRGGRPFAVASPQGAGELGAETGASGMVKLSDDSTTPMALQLKEETRKRALDDILYANRLKLEEELAKDPLFRERELAKIDQQKQEALLGAQGRSATMAYDRARKMQASQRIDQQAMEYSQALQEKYAKDPIALERAMTQLQRDVMSRKQAIEADYGSS